MKFILVNLEDLHKECELKKYRIDDTHYINELSFSQDKLTTLLQAKQGMFNNLRQKLYRRKVKKELYSGYKTDKQMKDNCYYILSNNVSKKNEQLKYITKILESFGIKKYILPSEMNTSLPKYISEYVNDKNLTKHELNVLFVYKDLKNINFELLENCIKEYKKVNIYLAEKHTETILKRIAKINNEHGSSIEIIKYNKKAFLEYNVVYFADDFRTNYPRMRIDKNALVLDEQDAKCDKYNSNIEFFNRVKKNIEGIDKLYEQYSILSLAIVVRKIVN